MNVREYIGLNHDSCVETSSINIDQTWLNILEEEITLGHINQKPFSEFQIVHYQVLLSCCILFSAVVFFFRFPEDGGRKCQVF